jgi:SAM-dependent methyltransferase
MIHPSAERGFAAAADEYERSRPSYPADAVEWMARELDIGTSSRVLDLAAGTGKLTELLVRFGADVVAVEPVEEMRRWITAKLPEVEVLPGTAEAIPLADRTVDAVVVAQAFHWFDAPAAASEIHRVLKPEGRLGVVFNVRDEDVDWQGRLTEVFRPFEGDTPRYRHGRWRDVLDAGELFTHPRSATFPLIWPATRESILERVRSMSFVAAASDDDRARILDGVRVLLDSHPDLAGRAEIPFPYRTECSVWDRAA